jgi:flagellar hook assembly protein FlgD
VEEAMLFRRILLVSALGPVGNLFADDFEVSFRYQLLSNMNVTIEIYNTSDGSKVVTVLNDVSQNSGYYTISWDGRNSSGNIVSSVQYICRLTLRKGSSSSVTNTQFYVIK